MTPNKNLLFLRKVIYTEMKPCCYVATTPRLNAIAAFFHAVQCAIVFGLIGWLNSQPYGNTNFRVEKYVNVWHKFENKTVVESMIKNRAAMNKDFYVQFKTLDVGSLDVRYIVAFFFLLSAAFQTWGAYVLNPKTVFRLRFLEYSFSASIMMLAIAVETGFRDVYILEMMFILIWSTMIFGIMADFMSDVVTYLDGSAFVEEPLLIWLGPWAWIIPHFAGWVTCCAAYIPVIDMFMQSSKESEAKAPGFVHVIVFLQFVLFSCFGLVQFYALAMRTMILQSRDHSIPIEMMRQNGVGEDEERFIEDSRGSYKTMRLMITMENAERAYITLSFVAKTLLAWLILSPIIANAAQSD